MDNSKIIKIKGGTSITSHRGINFNLKLAQNFTVVSETETHYFFRYKENEDKRLSLFSIRKSEVHNVTFKDRTITFSDLKKAEILNIFTNYKKLIQKAQQISKEISKYWISCDDMSLYPYDGIFVFHNPKKNIMTLTYTQTIGKEQIRRGCDVPYKYLWDKNWKRTVKRDYYI